MISPKIPSNIIETLRFSIAQTYKVGKWFGLIIFCTQILEALVAPLAVLLVGKLASSMKDSITSQAAIFTDSSLWLFLGGFMSILFVLCKIIGQYAAMSLGDRLSLHMQYKIIEHTGQLDLEQIEDQNIQNIIERASQNPGRNMLLFFTGALNVGSSLIAILGLLGVFFWITPAWATIIALFCLPVLAGNRYLSVINFNLKRNKTTARRWAKYFTQQVSNRLLVPTTKTMRLNHYLLDKFTEQTENIHKANCSFYKKQGLVNLVTILLLIFILLISMIYLTQDMQTGILDVGKYTAFWLAAWRLQISLTKLGRSFFDISETEFSISNIKELFSIKHQMTTKGVLSPKKISGKVSLQNVSFRYQGCSKYALHNISLNIKEGETVAIVGANGSGKSTLAKLIAQLYSPTNGEIHIDNRPATNYVTDCLYKNISIVTQIPPQFEATAAENLALGDWEKLVNNPSKIEKEANNTQVSDMIEKLPEGFNTLLGRLFGSYDLSGGQWQKLAIARALVSQPSVIILDEPSAALDIQSEYELYSSIQKMVKNKTTILISHRFSTVRMADRIFVLNEGLLIESGSHQELIDQNGTYAVMYNTYNKISL